MVLSSLSLGPTVEVRHESSSPPHELSGLLSSLTLSPPTDLELHPVPVALAPLPASLPALELHPIPAALDPLPASLPALELHPIPAALPAHAPLAAPLPVQLQINRALEEQKKRKRFVNLLHWKWDEVITLDDEEETLPKASSTRSVKRRRTNLVSIFGNKRVNCFGHDNNEEDA